MSNMFGRGGTIPVLRYSTVSWQVKKTQSGFNGILRDLYNEALLSTSPESDELIDTIYMSLCSVGRKLYIISRANAMLANAMLANTHRLPVITKLFVSPSHVCYLVIFQVITSNFCFLLHFYLTVI